jgi:hypothetical protein
MPSTSSNSEYGYLVRRVGQIYEVTKWGDSSLPLEKYTVRDTRRGWSCNSPGCHRKTKCKHANIVVAWNRGRYGERDVPVMLKEDGTPFSKR